MRNESISRERQCSPLFQLQRTETRTTVSFETLIPHHPLPITGFPIPHHPLPITGFPITHHPLPITLIRNGEWRMGHARVTCQEEAEPLPFEAPITHHSSPITCFGFPLPVGPGLHAAAAHRHRAPGTRAVLGVIEKSPMALAVAAGFEPGPTAFAHGRVGDSQQTSHGTVHSGRAGHEFCPPLAVEADAEPAPLGRAVEDRDGVGSDGPTTITQQQGAQRLPDFERPLPVGLADHGAFAQQPVVDQPEIEVGRALEFIHTSFQVGGVHELAKQFKLAWCALMIRFVMVARRHFHHYYKGFIGDIM